MRTLILGLMVLAAGCKESEEGARAAERKAAQARVLADEARAEAVRRAGQAETYAKGGVGLARTVKSELDKVYRTDRDYDLAITRAGASKDHAARLAAMPHVQVGDVTVGYEEETRRSFAGVSYARHFRATWRRGDEDVVVSYATQEHIDPVAFVALVEKLVPIVERELD
jgi:hypothetical protein